SPSACSGGGRPPPHEPSCPLLRVTPAPGAAPAGRPGTRRRPIPGRRRQSRRLLALPLLVLRVLADDPDDPIAPDHLALRADPLGGRLDLHHPFAPYGRVSTTGPSAVTASVCSKCAERLPSRVTAVQPSLRIRTSGPPAFTIGSIARTRPSVRRRP